LQALVCPLLLLGDGGAVVCRSKPAAGARDGVAVDGEGAVIVGQQWKAREGPAYLTWRMVVSTEKGPTKNWIAAGSRRGYGGRGLGAGVT